jgi:hypothetical protein
VAADQRNLLQFVFRLIGCQLLTCDLICYQLCGDLFATCHFRCPSLLFRCPVHQTLSVNIAYGCEMTRSRRSQHVQCDRVPSLSVTVIDRIHPLASTSIASTRYSLPQYALKYTPPTTRGPTDFAKLV